MATSTKQVYDYVLKTPENINGNVLKSFLNDVSGGTGNLDDFIAGKISEITCNLENIPDFAFAAKSELETVNLPNAIYIGKYAFSSAPTSQSGSGSGSSNGEGSEGSEGEEDLVFNNKKLKTVNMNKVTHIERDAFRGDENLEITELPDSLLVIEDNAFRDCPKVQLTEFPKNVIYIGDGAFNIQENIDLSTIPNDLIYMGSGILNYDSVREYLASFVEDGVLSSDFPVIWLNISTGDLSNVQKLKNYQVTTADIPEGATRIPERCFEYDGNIRNVTIPSTCKIIEGAAFAFSSLQNITIRDGLEKIEWTAFSNCSNLEEIIMPNSVKYLGDNVFDYCTNLLNITFSDNIEYIDGRMSNIGGIWNEENIGWLHNLSEGPVYIGKVLYKYKGTLPESSFAVRNGTTQIGLEAFASKPLQNIIIPYGVKTISDLAFSGCDLRNVELPDSIEDIGTSAFRYNYNLHNINIPINLKQIPMDFIAHSSVENIIIPNSVEDIKYYSFGNCSQLKNVDLSNLDHVINIESGVFQNNHQNLKFYFANSEILEQYASATNWSQYADKFVVGTPPTSE